MRKKLKDKIKKIIETLKKRGICLATMESCTGGALINAITSIPGASEITKGGIVAYSTEQKIKFGVKKSLIEKFTVYSKEVAIEMAKISQKIFNCQLGIGITGILSRKDPKNPERKVGEVFVGIILGEKEVVKFLKLSPEKEREREKERVVEIVLKMIETVLK